MRQKFVIVVLLFVVLALVAVAAYFAGRSNWNPWAPPVPPATVSSTPPPVRVPPTSSTPPPASTQPGWKAYSDSSISFTYPEAVTLTTSGTTLMLRHTVPYVHADPCDFQGSAPMRNVLTDLDLTIRVEDVPMDTAIDANEGSPFVTSQYFQNNTLSLEAGFIDAASAGSLAGFRITSGAEGCGRYAYYFPISASRTLVINRAFVPEFSPIVENSQVALALPGVYTPTNEEAIVAQFLASIEVLP